MFPLAFIALLSKILKALPYVALVGVMIFGVFKLESCSGGLSESKDVLKARLETQKQANAILKESNKDNLETVKDLSSSSKATLDSVTKQTQDEKKVAQAASQRELEVKRKLDAVIKSYQTNPKNLEASRKKDLDVSTIQINSIWGSYCDNNAADQQCKAAS